MLVELDVFSGRPNPRWELDEQSSKKLLQIQSRLRRTRESPPDPPGLGYRGFWYADATTRVRAYRGYVTTTRTVLRDPAFSIEQFLLDRLPPEYAALRQRIVAELKPAK